MATIHKDANVSSRKLKKYLFSILILNRLPYKAFLKLAKYFEEDKLYRDLKFFEDSGFPISCVFDIGAHKGSWAQEYHKRFRHAEIILFEANPVHRDALASTGYRCYITLLSDVKKSITFFNKGGTGDSYYKENTNVYADIEGAKMQAVTLDDIVRSEQLLSPDFLKIDTQGSEIDILNGAQDVLRGVNFILLECPIFEYNVGAPQMNEYVRFLEGIGFHPYSLVEIHQLRGLLTQVDILFVRKEILGTIHPESIDFYGILEG